MKKGFTIIELIMVISIVAILGAIMMPMSTNLLVRQQLRTKTNELVTALRTAQINTLAGKQADQWGVRLENNQIIMFKGSSWTSPGTSFDHYYDLPGTITPSPTPTEIVFGKLTGNPSNTITITLTNRLGEVKNISINPIGTVDVN